ncbi:MAG: AAA family ATPase [Cyanobacteria bacterium SBLK]|nr:AAA family ATPase [Cyanobacteria bacterium SBLK]
MVKKIALFNHKGGVSKTTTTFNLGWMLADKGKTVILVDTDPQCNLTGMALGEQSEENLEEIYKSYSNIKTGLAPAFESQPRAIEAVDCIPIGNKKNLFLLPGHVGFAENEVTLGLAQELSGAIQALKNVPGSISYLLEKTAQKFNADYILIDMSPSLSSINQNLLMTSNFFIVPTNADFFSVMAIDSLTKILPKWYLWATKASSLQILKDATYPFPEINLKFLGAIVQKYRIRGGKATVAFEKWIQKIEQDIDSKLAPILGKNHMLLSSQTYTDNEISQSYTLSKIPEFNSLIALSQEHQVPVYALTKEQLGWTGSVLQGSKRKQEEFSEIFSDLADKIIKLTATA